MTTRKASPFCIIGVCVQDAAEILRAEPRPGTMPLALLVTQIEFRVAVPGELDRAGPNAAGPADGDEGRSQVVAIAACLSMASTQPVQRQVLLDT